MSPTSQPRFEAVDPDRWDDLARLFESRGSPHYCWCMAWREKPPGFKQADAKDRKAMLKAAMCQRVADGVPVGILGYRGDEPIAWCSIAPRATYRSLGGPAEPGAEDAVWSVACFFVKRAYRGEGMMHRLLEAATAHARRQGARIVEAYPVDRDSPSYRYMGVVDIFQRAGFERVGTAGSRRHVVRLALD